MIKDFSAFSATEVGYNHIKVNKVCEDASDYYDDDHMHICVVADGHGSDNYPRTDRGSKLAVDSAIKCIVDFVNVASPEDVLADENRGYPVLLQLAKSILMDWHESVDADYSANPFTETELKGVSEKYKMKYLSEDSEERKIEKAYGCTLVIYAVTEAYSFGMQIGDGKCVVVTREGDFTEPIPWDENCQLNVTTSICDEDAIDEFRFFVTNQFPTAVFCGSDGIDDSYANSEELYALYRSILKIFIEHGADVGKDEIREYLPVLTKKGSGDDVSVGLILDIEWAKKLSHRFDIQADLFALNEKLNEKKQQLNANIEKDNALSFRIRKWLDSGRKSNDSGMEDVHKVNDLRGAKESLDTEIRELESNIKTLEAELLQPVVATSGTDTETQDVNVQAVENRELSESESAEFTNPEPEENNGEQEENEVPDESVSDDRSEAAETEKQEVKEKSIARGDSYDATNNTEVKSPEEA